MKLATVVNFCTNDYRFFDRCISEAASFSQEIIVPVCDHFFDGKPENLDLLHDIYARHPECKFIQYAYSKEKLYSQLISVPPEDVSWKMYWYTTSRYIGYLHLDPSIDYVLFLDIDEIIDGNRFKQWLDSKEYKKYDAMRLFSYFYFREASLQAETHMPNALLAKKNVLSHTILFNDWDRYGAYSRIQGNKTPDIVGLDKLPLVHHYSWVKSKEECLRKGETSGHFWEMDFKNQIEKEFSREFQGSDFVFSYKYQKVVPFFDPLTVSQPKSLEKSNLLPHVCYEDHKKVFRKALELEFNL